MLTGAIPLASTSIALRPLYRSDSKVSGLRRMLEKMLVVRQLDFLRLSRLGMLSESAYQEKEKMLQICYNHTNR